MRPFMKVRVSQSHHYPQHSREHVTVPSAASFYVPSLPDIHQDPINPLKIFAGHLSSDPKAAQADDKDITAHLYFVLVKNRRHADKERVMFWFNVRVNTGPYANLQCTKLAMCIGRTRMLFI